MITRSAVSMSLRLAAFAFAFTVDVRAKASVFTTELTPVQRPELCLTKPVTQSCAVATDPGKKLALDLGSGRLTLAEDSVVVRSGEGEASLLRGAIWARSEQTMRISVEFGDIQIEAGQAWIWREDGRIWIDAFAGAVSIAPRGSGARLAVRPGMRNWLGPVGTRGAAEIGFPKALDLTVSLARLARVYDGDKAAFEAVATGLADAWRGAVREVASLDEERARSRLSVLEERERVRVERIRSVENQNRGLRELFRRKTFE